jgi:hypothetical protein
MDLATFLLACIAEDEEAAKRAAFGWGAEWLAEHDSAEDWSTVHADGKRDMVGCEDPDVPEHIARHDPARVLAECEAKRRIVAHWPDPFGNWDHTQASAAKAVKDHALRALALPYADHPDYRDEWRP